MHAGPVRVRPRVDTDRDELVQVASAVQKADGYPGRRPRDLGAFMVADDALGAWVADDGGAVAGHVALHSESLPVVMETAGVALRRHPSELAVVARLIVDPARRRRGIGRALLEAAAADARRRGLHPILDVARHYDAAIALYRSCGWRNAGEVTMVFADGTHLPSYVLVAPDE